MSCKIHVANLSYTTDGPTLEGLFAPYGLVRGAEILSDRMTTSSSIGLGLVEMGSNEEAESAIAALDGSLFRGRVLKVGWYVAGAPRPPARAEVPAAPGPVSLPGGERSGRCRGPGGGDFESDESIGEAGARRRGNAGGGGTSPRG